METDKVESFVLDPRTKLVLWLMANFIVFIMSPQIDSLAIMLLYVVLFLLSHRADTMFKILAVYLCILLIQFFVLPVLPPMAAVVLATAGYAGMIFPCFVGGYYLIATTGVGQFLAAMRAMHLPESMCIMMAVTLRFLPAIRREFRNIRDAMSLRRIKGLGQKMECIYVPMLMGIAETAEELSESVITRGIENPHPKTSWQRAGFHAADIVVLLLFLAVCAAAVIGKAAAV